jgi:hypothetical protein
LKGNSKFLKPDEIIENRQFSSLFKNSGKFRGRSFFKILKSWPVIAGKELKDIITVKKLENDILYLVVQNSSWLQNVSFMKDMLKKKVLEIDSKIKDIKFEVKKRGKTHSFEDFSIDYSNIFLNQNELQQAEKMTEHIENPELKDKLRGLYIKKLKYEKYCVENGYKICKNCKSVYNGKKCDRCGVE